MDALKNEISEKYLNKKDISPNGNVLRENISPFLSSCIREVEIVGKVFSEVTLFL